jgi:hypothetical protein
MIFLYSRFLQGTSDATESIGIARSFCATRNLCGTVEVITDPASSADVPWLLRPAGAELLRRLAGDACDVVVACGGQIWTSADDLSDSLAQLFTGQATVHFVAQGLSLAPAHSSCVKAALRLFDYVSFNFRSQAIKEGLSRRKRELKRWCRRSPQGFRWVGRKGHQSLAVDEEEWADMLQIWRWWREGFSHERIYFHLLQLGICRRSGATWSLSAIKRATQRVEMQARKAVESQEVV